MGRRAFFTAKLLRSVIGVFLFLMALFPLAEPSHASPSFIPESPGVKPSGFDEFELGRTPLQQAFEQALNEKRAQGSPVPSSVSYDFDVVADPKRDGSDRHFRVAARTVLEFDSPEQAGLDRWPDYIIREDLHCESGGLVAPGNYSQLVRDTTEDLQPGIWNRTEYGHEPKTISFEETYDIFYPPSTSEPAHSANVLSSKEVNGSDSTITQDILFGFTNSVRFSYEINQSVSSSGVTVWARAGYSYGWDTGLRLPLEVTLIAPDSMMQGDNRILRSYVEPKNWDILTYQAAHVPAFGGKELVLQADYLLYMAAGIRVPALGWDHRLVDCTLSNYLEIDESELDQDFETPFGNQGYPLGKVDLDPDNTGMKVSIWDGYFKVGLGFEIAAAIGSNRIDATWQAEGDALGGGSIGYTAPGTSVNVGPLLAGDFSPDRNTYVRLTNFRYHLNQLLIDLYAYLQLDWDINIWPVNTSGTFETPPLLIYSFAQTLPIYPEFSVHAGTTDALRVGPIPVVSPIRITKTADKVPPVPVGDIVTVTSSVSNTGTHTLSNVEIRDNGIVIATGVTLPAGATYGPFTSQHIATTERDMKSVTQVVGSLPRGQQVSETGELLIYVLNGVVGSGTAASCNEQALDADLFSFTTGEEIRFDCGGTVSITVQETKAINRNVTLSGGGFITISGGDPIKGDNSVRVFDVPAGLTLTLRNLTVKNGSAHAADSDPAEAGGGIRNAGTVNLHDCTIVDNTADYGGGIHNSASGIVLIDHSALSRNSADWLVNPGNGDGGAIYNDGGTVNITNSSTIGGSQPGDGNIARGGGGILNWNNGTIEIRNSTLSGNFATFKNGLGVTGAGLKLVAMTSSWEPTAAG